MALKQKDLSMILCPFSPKKSLKGLDAIAPPLTNREKSSIFSFLTDRQAETSQGCAKI